MRIIYPNTSAIIQLYNVLLHNFSLYFRYVDCRYRNFFKNCCQVVDFHVRLSVCKLPEFTFAYGRKVLNIPNVDKIIHGLVEDYWLKVSDTGRSKIQ